MIFYALNERGVKKNNKMKIGFIGNGGMSQAMQNIARTREHEINCVVDKGMNWDFDNSDIVCEVSHPSVCVDHIKKLCEMKQDTIVVTTGWYDDLEEVKKIVKDSGIRFLYSSNFSIGVNLYFRIVEKAAKLINNVDEYDVWGHEIHHKNKVDSPSGTAKTLEEILLKNITRKTAIVEEKLDRKIKDNEIHFSSTRGGLSNFAHTIGFDSEADCIEIKHFARNRNGYALGAIKCAEWLKKQKSGFYTMEDFLKSCHCER